MLPLLDHIFVEKFAFDHFSKKHYKSDKLFFLDGGIETFRGLNHALYPTWVGSWNFNNIKNPQLLTDRTYLFLILARVAKTYRVKFVIEILERGLDAVSLISCGSASENQHLNMTLFDDIVPGKFRDIKLSTNKDKLEKETYWKKQNEKVFLNGDMANEFNDSHLANEDDEDDELTI